MDESIRAAANTPAINVADVVATTAAAIAGAGDNADHIEDSKVDASANAQQANPNPNEAVLEVVGDAIGASSFNDLLQRLGANTQKPIRPVQKHSLEDLLARIDAAGAVLSELADDVERYLETQDGQLGYDCHFENGGKPTDAGDAYLKSDAKGWLGVSLVSLKTGLDQLRRALKQPTHF